MALPEFTMRQLLEAGVHFGHHTRRWNPKNREFIFGVRGGVHIIDLQQTTPMLADSLKAVRDIVSNGGRVLFVGTKRQAQEKIAESAKRCGQYYVNHRWMGGMLTNWKTISKSITRLRELETLFASEEEQAGHTKKELLMMRRQYNKLESAIGGIKDMGGQPDAVIVIDTNKEAIAIQEANKLSIPVFAVVDTNTNPDGVDYIIPGNDDALRAISLYCDLFADAILDGLQAEITASGKDTGAAVNPKAAIPAKKKAKPAAEKAKKADAPAKEEKADKGEKKVAPKKEEKPEAKTKIETKPEKAPVKKAKSA